MLTLNRIDLQELAGRQRPDAIMRWLDAQQIPYLVGADGWPRVLTAIIQSRMGQKQEVRREPRVRL